MTQLLIPAVRVSPVPTAEIHAKVPNGNRAKPAKTTATEPLSRAIRSAGNIVHYLKDGLPQPVPGHRRLLEERKDILTARLHHAETWRQWDKAAHELDELEGNEEWKKDNHTGDYDPELIQDRLRALEDARKGCDLRAMLHLIRTALARDLGGMGNIDLYRHSYCGTKKLIERYVESTLQNITVLVEQSSHALPDGLEPKDLLDTMIYARQSFGRSALLLSGGGTFGMTHIGVLKAMFEVKLLPRIISGASAGSIVSAVVCTRTDDEIPQLLADFPHGDLAVFDEPGNEDGLVDHLRRLLTEGNWSDIKHLTRVMRSLLGDMTFQEAYNRTRRICNICVSSASVFELPRLLNYVTSPNVMIWSAVAASCSVPVIFSAAPLLVKNPLTGEHDPWNPTPQMWIDGSVDNDLPMTRLAEMFNVNHFIVSQVNPHVVPFLATEDTPYTAAASASDHQPLWGRPDWIRTIAQLAKSEALHRMQTMAEFGIFPNLVTKLTSVLSQKYSGDINILPAMGVLDLPTILTNPTTDFMFRSCLSGERATWPKLSRVRDRCAIELALDRAVHALKARVVFSKSQADLRRMLTGTNIGPLGGSHEPHDAMVLPTENLFTTRHKLWRRHRRSSGSSSQPIPNKSKHSYAALEVMDPGANYGDDDDDDNDERLEMTSKRTRAKPDLRMRRLPTDQLETGFRTDPRLFTLNEPNAIDLAKSAPPSNSLGLSQSAVRLSWSAAVPSNVGPIEFDAPYVEVIDGSKTPSMFSTQRTIESRDGDTFHSSDADIDSLSGGGAGNSPTDSSKFNSSAA